VIPLNDTAYPRFKTHYSPAELARCYTPTAEDIALCDRATRGDTTRLGFILLLKTFQRLGYFVRSAEVPDRIIAHLAEALGEPPTPSTLHRYDDARARKNHIGAIRAYLQVNAFSQGGDAVLQRALREAALTKEDLADIINVGLETLIRFRYELPAFSTLVREARRQRKAAYQDIFQTIHDRLGALGRAFLDRLLVTDSLRRLSPWNDLKQETPKPTIKAAHALLQHYARLVELTGYDHLLQPIPLVKVKQLAIEARSLDVTSLAEFEPLKRYALMLALIRMQWARITDDLCEVLIKQMSRVQNKAKTALDEYLEKNQAKTDEIIRRYSLLADVLDSGQTEADQLRHIRTLVKSQPDLCEYSHTHAEFGGKQPMRFMWRYFKMRRAALLRILSTLRFVSTTQDDTLVRALHFVLAHRQAKAEWIPTRGSKACDGKELVALLDLSWIPEAWWRRVTGLSDPDRFSEQINRRYFEVCLCLQLVQELKSGDICVIGSHAYSDYRQELLPLAGCEKTLAEYGEQVGLPIDPNEFIAHVKNLLAQAGSQTDEGYPANEHFEIINGEPRLKKLKRKPSPKDLDSLEEKLSRRLDHLDLTLLDVFTETMKWLRWGRFFGPLSGYQRKITEEAKRYILTVFAYGTGLGPLQAAKTIPGITARQIAFINQRHITAEKLDAAIREVINAYNKFDLPRYWGDGKHAAADGTQWDVYENNLLSEYHIRYGSYGGVAYYHVSDTYIALFSHFIPCGVWEAVYILDGLMKNASDIQPDVLHGDTQSQSTPVYAFAFLLGIKLLPRIRNWKDLRFYKAAADLNYQHINDLFTRERVDWALIERHLPDMFQVAQSIKAGVISPSTILRKFGTVSRKNRLYYAFRELGRVIRTVSLLEYISDIELQRLVNTMTNKCELFNKFAKWAYFAEDLIQENVRDEQVKIIKYNHLIANLLIFHNVYSMTRILNEIEAQGTTVPPDVLSVLSPYRTGHINRFGTYELRDRDIDEVDYGLRLKASAAQRPARAQQR
jgi:TnpA family transposase